MPSDDVEVVLELLVELLPQAASARVAVIAASAGNSRRARRGVFVADFICLGILSCSCRSAARVLHALDDDRVTGVKRAL
jgi:hypothetical protein